MSKDGLRPAIGRIAGASIRGAIEAGALQTAHELGARPKPATFVAAIASRRATRIARAGRRVDPKAEIRKMLEAQRPREVPQPPAGWMVSDSDFRPRRPRGTIW